MFYFITCFLSGLVARIFLHIRLTGIENIPKDGGVIIAANHLSYLDIPLLGYSTYGIRRDVDYMGKKELFAIPVIGYLLRRLGGFPVDREKLDRTAFREAIKRLKSGRVLIIYPEGRRSRDGRLQSGKPGVGMMVKMSGVKVIPAAIIGTDKALPPGSWMIKPTPVTIEFGKPLDFTGMGKSSGEKGDIENITNIIMEGINTLIKSRLPSV